MTVSVKIVEGTENGVRQTVLVVWSEELGLAELLPMSCSLDDAECFDVDEPIGQETDSKGRS
jgi:hypothetical protein